MQYLFITKLFNLEVDTILNKGKEIRPGSRITNNSNRILEIINQSVFKNNIGEFSIDEFIDYSGSTYIARGHLPISKEERDSVASNYNFFFLREIQNFIYHLWHIKDNNVYVRDGFLLLYENTITDGLLYKDSLSEIFTKSDLSKEPTTFSTSDLDVAIKKWGYFDIDELKSAPSRYPTDDIFKKSKDVTPVDRTFYNIISAKSSSVYPMKILFYCAALESLFSYEKSSEIAHRIAERVAWFVGENLKERKEIFKQVKKSYNVRSTVIHGSFFKEQELINMREISMFLDSVLRDIYSSPEFGKLDLQDSIVFENYFLEKLMTD